MIFDSKTGQVITTLESRNGSGIPEVLPPEGRIVCLTDKNYFTSGRCGIDLRFYLGMERSYKLKNAGFFDVEVETTYGTSKISRGYGMFFLKHEWSIDN